MSFSAPDILKTVDRTRPATTKIPLPANGTAKPKTAQWQPGENFSGYLNRQQQQKVPTDSTAAARQLDELPSAYLNRLQTPPVAAAVETAPQTGETSSQFLNRRHVAKVQLPAVNHAIAKTDTTSALKPAETPTTSLNHNLTPDAPDAATARQQKAEKAAGDLVSNALILPMLKQLRRSPWGENTVFSGGIGEKTFGPEFDIQIADRIAHSPRLGVKTALGERLMQRSTPKTAADVKKLTDVNELDVHG